MSEWGLAGIQSSGTLVSDEIDFERGVYIKRIGSVDLGSLMWYRFIESSSTYTYSARIPTKETDKSVITEAYPLDRYKNPMSLADNTIMLHNTINAVYIRDDRYTTNQQLKSSLSGKILYYTLATPEEYPLPKVDNNYISSDYGVEQFDSVVPCNANNLYYMRSLTGETRNFLDRLYNNTDKADAKEVADYIANGIKDNKELATNAPNLALRTLFIAAGAEYNDTDAV
jgi:hypothetical protein